MLLEFLSGLVVTVAPLAGADGALERVFVNDAFVGEGFEDGFVFLAVALLGVGFGGAGGGGGAAGFAELGARAGFAVAGEWRGATEGLPAGR